MIEIFSAAVRAEDMVYFPQGVARTQSWQQKGRQCTHVHMHETNRYAAKNTAISTAGVAMKDASDMKWLECRHGAANENPLNMSSLKTAINARNFVKIGGHGISNTTFREALI